MNFYFPTVDASDYPEAELSLRARLAASPAVLDDHDGMPLDLVRLDGGEYGGPLLMEFVRRHNAGEKAKAEMVSSEPWFKRGAMTVGGDGARAITIRFSAVMLPNDDEVIELASIARGESEPVGLTADLARIVFHRMIGEELGRPTRPGTAEEWAAHPWLTDGDIWLATIGQPGVALFSHRDVGDAWFAARVESQTEADRWLLDPTRRTAMRRLVSLHGIPLAHARLDIDGAVAAGEEHIEQYNALEDVRAGRLSTISAIAALPRDVVAKTAAVRAQMYRCLTCN